VIRQTSLPQKIFTVIRIVAAIRIPRITHPIMSITIVLTTNTQLTSKLIGSEREFLSKEFIHFLEGLLISDFFLLHDPVDNVVANWQVSMKVSSTYLLQ
jgi:hypothetical protein